MEDILNHIFGGHGGMGGGMGGFDSMFGKREHICSDKIYKQ